MKDIVFIMAKLNKPYVYMRDKIMSNEIISTVKHKHGYIVKTELVKDMGDDHFEVQHAYNENDEYIGNPEFASHLFEMGIKPTKSQKSNNVCSIGFCEKESKWYGWSHRSIYGFGVGSEVKKGDCAYVPVNRDDFLDDMINFWSGENHINVKGRHDMSEGSDIGIYVSWEYDNLTPNEKLRGQISGSFSSYPKEYGFGDWTAKTIEDAKQMAKDFSDGVS